MTGQERPQEWSLSRPNFQEKTPNGSVVYFEHFFRQKRIDPVRKRKLPRCLHEEGHIFQLSQRLRRLKPISDQLGKDPVDQGSDCSSQVDQDDPGNPWSNMGLFPLSQSGQGNPWPGVGLSPLAKSWFPSGGGWTPSPEAWSSVAHGNRLPTWFWPSGQGNPPEPGLNHAGSTHGGQPCPHWCELSGGPSCPPWLLEQLGHLETPISLHRPPSGVGRCLYTKTFPSFLLPERKQKFKQFPLSWMSNPKIKNNHRNVWLVQQ